MNGVSGRFSSKNLTSSKANVEPHSTNNTEVVTDNFLTRRFIGQRIPVESCRGPVPRPHVLCTAGEIGSSSDD